MHTGCIGHNRAGLPCGAQVMRGTGDRPRCRSHLGRSPGIVKAEADAQRIAAARLEEARRAAKAHGTDGIDPLAELLLLADEALTWKSVCKSMVGTLEEVRYKSAGAGEQLRAEVALFERSMDRAGRILVDISRLGGADWLMRLSADQSVQVATAIGDALAELAGQPGFTADTPLVRQVVAQHLREVTR